MVISLHNPLHFIPLVIRSCIIGLFICLLYDPRQIEANIPNRVTTCLTFMTLTLSTWKMFSILTTLPKYSFGSLQLLKGGKLMLIVFNPLLCLSLLAISFYFEHTLFYFFKVDWFLLGWIRFLINKTHYFALTVIVLVFDVAIGRVLRNGFCILVV